MTLKEKINQDLIAALKGGKNDAVSTLRFLLSAVKNKELEKRTKLSKSAASPENLEKESNLTDEELASVILGEIKKRKESITQYENGGRPVLAEKERAEVDILKKYAPEEMPREELAAIVKLKIASVEGAAMKDFGKIMGLVKAEVKGRAGGEDIKNIIEEELKK